MSNETKFRLPRLPHLPEHKSPQNQADEKQNEKDYQEALHRALQEGLIQIDGVLGPRGSGPVSVTATTPIVVTPSPLINTGVISHAASGVAAATYGDATHVPQVAVDAKGHVTGVTNVAITGGGLAFFRSSGMTVPLAASFAGTMGTLASTTDKSDRLQVTKASTVSDMAMLYITAPTAPYTLDICGSMLGMPPNSNDTLIGAGRSDGTKLEVIWSGGTGVAGTPQVVAVQKWSTTTGAVTTTQTGQATTNPALVYVRLIDDATTCFYYFSNNGKDYFLVFSEARNTFLTATRIGVCFYHVNILAGGGGTAVGKFAIYDFTVTGSALGDAA